LERCDVVLFPGDVVVLPRKPRCPEADVGEDERRLSSFCKLALILAVAAREIEFLRELGEGGL